MKTICLTVLSLRKILFNSTRHKRLISIMWAFGLAKKTTVEIKDIIAPVLVLFLIEIINADSSLKYIKEQLD